MTNDRKVIGPSDGFEESKHEDEDGVEYWTAREILPLFGYASWQSFNDLVLRAIKASFNSGQNGDDHFRQLTKMVGLGSGSRRAVRDWKLSRYACYLIAQNGDPRIVQIARAQTYFAIQTRRQELFEGLSDAEKRIFIRGEVSSENKKLFKTAKDAGVRNFGMFNDAGYRGLYGMPLSQVEARKRLKKGALLDHAGSTELAANLFRITQTDEKLRKDRARGQESAMRTHNMVGGKVRQTIKDIGGVLPENLVPERNIKEVRREVRKLDAGKRRLAAPKTRRKRKP